MAFDPAIVSNNVVDAFNIAVRDAILFIPNILEAVLLLVLGYFISEVIGRIIAGVLDYLRVERVLQKYRVEDALGGNEISPLLSTAAKWYIMLMFLTAAVEALELSSINWLISAALMFAPVLIGVGLLIIVAAIIGEWLREAILDLKKFYLQKTLAELIKWVVVILSVMVSLETIGFQMGFVREVFNILLQGIVYGIAIAFGLAFGLGGQKDAQDLVRKTRRRLKL